MPSVSPERILYSTRELEILGIEAFLDEEGVAADRVLGRRFAGDRAVLDAPELGVAGPAFERLTVKERYRLGLGGRGAMRDRQANRSGDRQR